MSEPIFFDSPEAWRTWLAEHHDTASDVQLGLHKKHTGRATLTWSDAVDQAICFGWIDGVRHSLGPDASMLRFTPRKARSTWSKINIAKVERLREAGLMTPAGETAFARRTEANSGIYSFERESPAALDPEEEARLRADAVAWAFHDSQPPGYQRTALHWVVSAKKPETRARRLDQLIADSAAGLRPKHLRR